MTVPPADDPAATPIGSTFNAIAGKVWLWPVIRGVLAIILGIIALVAPLSTAVTFAVLVGIYAIVDGVITLIDALRHRGYGGVGLRVAVAVIDIIFGILVLVWPGLTLLVLVFLAGFWAIVLGALEIVVNIRSRRQHSGWIWGVVTGALAVVFGIVIVVQPGIGLVALTTILGIFAILFGLFWIAVGLMIRKAGR
ncbi:HdeD family acid-resistance protein [Microlunatus soli]|uniref:Uncharacterized membrane protein HdeD, DUF308 family n=1 Tax=Microlunatus soli TaxID=630515 RepID=A0A1H1NTM8_9ACTN|nr:HdeD family acid-resistance protein [Microlunatus soli]SDS02341.1 Uncharacterized membrane protein HdeD, DUF308 family [Microlunatus soli]